MWKKGECRCILEVAYSQILLTHITQKAICRSENLFICFFDVICVLRAFTSMLFHQSCSLLLLQQKVSYCACIIISFISSFVSIMLRPIFMFVLFRTQKNNKLNTCGRNIDYKHYYKKGVVIDEEQIKIRSANNKVSKALIMELVFARVWNLI